MKSLILIILSLIAAQATYGFERNISARCGNSEVTLIAKGETKDDDGAQYFDEVNISATGNQGMIAVKEEANDFFKLGCLSSKGRYFIVYQNYCGGSGCRDLDNYGIIDAMSLKHLLKPSDDNRQKASKMVGMTTDNLKNALDSNVLFRLSNRKLDTE
jgi:hypothetical protein